MNRRPYALVALAIVGVTVLNCTDAHRVTAPRANTVTKAPPVRPDLGFGLTLLACNPQPYDSVVQTVGPLGGTIQAGPHTLVIPPGALDTNTTIAAVVPAEPLAAVRFHPQGLTFARPAALTMSYADCPLAPLLPKWVVYTNDLLSILEIEQSIQNPLSRSVTGHIGHFSGYALAY